MKDIHIPIDLTPIVMNEYNSGKRKQELGKILIASLLEQISFDEDGGNIYCSATYHHFVGIKRI